VHKVLCNGNEVVSPKTPFLTTEIYICASTQTARARILMTTNNYKTTNYHWHKHCSICTLLLASVNLELRSFLCAAANK